MNTTKLTRALASLTVGGLVFAGATAAFAHHSNAMFDYTHGNERTITGTVNQFLWTNPHSYLDLAVTASSGNVQNWVVEFQGISLNSERGLTIDSFKEGDEVTVVIHPLKDGRTGGDFLSATLADGTEILPPEDD
ncbi:DUF6152 family protein [Pelagibacterium halotolerans]|uniref:Uncharacterized protein n=1 Tax=Pelagibacterium halotolerans (strain DSM 22347 / JCM 15775 / CGMCC 1.7692 / B2) TaxID=1082931 RepID=G4R737_PELHB|nr:DUF6152 family protein [Pelagibacterium halotolerans]AEQ50188.1 hypothetical protein KKY_141 [Pelagibacterium halotolerans B2]AEQ50191.1 hypothetical protein KKY_144 [Pelagibacterium halotolerans B2]QJR19805.1 hypothetical protein HKM20_16015 [Pelagibacterium halotolerans]QJR19807.1 hypothetical protein HKM20_16030 [Pelagibacterium halotolerans]SEA50130.1 hypothetical protein SAMN05428936_104223 [Pelagibacterium halotolerans]